MRKELKKAIVITAVAAMVVGSIPIMPAFADKKSEAESRKDELEEQSRSLENEQNSLNAEKDAAESYLYELDAELTAVNEKIYDLTQQSEKKKKQIRKTEKKLAKAEKSIQEQYADMKLRIQFMYEKGNTEYLNLLLSSESIADFLNKAEYVSKITDYDHKMLEKMQKTKEEIETTKANLEADNEKLLALKEEQEEEQAYLETVIAKKQTELENTIAGINSASADLSSVVTAIHNEEEIIAEIERIEAEAAAAAAAAESSRQASILAAQQAGQDVDYSPSPQTGSGSFIWPLPSQYRTRSSTFGGRISPITGAYEYHCGDDYPAPAGTPIYAVSGGTVTASGYSSGMGNYVIIDHGGGLSSVYMHASVLIAYAGQSVSQGETIALVGTTGPSTGNHLHISFRLNGAWVDPKNYIGG